MNRAWPAALLALLVAGCALRTPSPEAFAFGVVGDAPYTEAEERHFLEMMRRMDAEPLAFVVHVGDFKGTGPCSDALFEKRRSQFDASRHPFLYTPGDNEWADCRLRRNGSWDPLERLAKLRSVFFLDEWSLGRERIGTRVQSERVAPECAPYPENRLWARAGVRFVTLNVTGSNNNEGFDAASDAEARCRNEANRRWLEQAVGESAEAGTRALVVIIQANPFFERVHDRFAAQVVEAARRLAKPVLLVHGHTHLYRADTPFKDAAGQAVRNPSRLETYGSPVVGWVKVTVDPDTADIFSFDPRIEALAPQR